MLMYGLIFLSVRHVELVRGLFRVDWRRRTRYKPDPGRLRVSGGEFFTGRQRRDTPAVCDWPGDRREPAGRHLRPRLELCLRPSTAKLIFVCLFFQTWFTLNATHAMFLRIYSFDAGRSEAT